MSPRHKSKAGGTGRNQPVDPRAKPRDPKGPRPAQSGLAARQLAVDLIVDVLHEHQTFDECFAKRLQSRAYSSLESRDRGLARTIAANALRFASPLNDILAGFLNKPLPSKQGRVAAILLSGATQLLILKTPAHAAISLAVDQTRKAGRASHLDKLVNAVLRKVATGGVELYGKMDTAKSAIPPWLWTRWSETYGEQLTREIAEACLQEASLDITLKPACDPGDWSQRLGGILLETGSVRIAQAGRVEDLAGYAEGAWWVQDAAASLPARLLGDVANKDVADLCAAPGGKTLQLAALGARVVAVDIASTRLARIKQNLTRLNLDAELVEADATKWQPDGRLFDSVLLDAPCSATGTIRRHPDILHLKQPTDVAALVEIQKRILDNAAALVKPGGEIVYCTCSLQPDEGEDQISAFLTRHPEFEIRAIEPGEFAIPAGWITEAGYLRTLPCFTPAASKDQPVSPSDDAKMTGMDGFFAARLRRRWGE